MTEKGGMRYDSFHHHRRSIRMKGYDYASEGAYFVTICIKNRECVLGEVFDRSIKPNPANIMISKWWIELNNKFPSIQTDEHIVMPNHFHGIIRVGAALCGRPNPDVDISIDTNPPQKGHPHRGAPTLGNIIDWFKTMTTNEYIRRVKQDGWLPCAGVFWQRNYHERIIRNDDELNRIRQYIQNNPQNWDQDPENLKST